MKPYITAIERAFELAKTGKFLYISEIRERLRFEELFLYQAILATRKRAHRPSRSSNS